MLKLIPSAILVVFPVLAFASGNTTNDSFNSAKRMLEHQVYFDHCVTLYCGAEFDAQTGGVVVRFYCQREKTPEGAKLSPEVFRETAHWLIDEPLDRGRENGYL